LNINKRISCFILVFLLLSCGGSVVSEPPAPLFDIDNQDFSQIDMPQYDVPLLQELQEFTFNQCLKHDLSYSLVLAIMKTESNFNTMLVSSTNDYGLMQINKINHKWLSETICIEKFDPHNPYHNIEAGIWFLAYIRDYWANKYEGICDEDLFFLTVLSYNRGMTGARKYIEKYGWNNSYVTKVYENKSMIETK
jgi:membrane-bound lytic murein transglycosylase MltF